MWRENEIRGIADTIRCQIAQGDANVLGSWGVKKVGYCLYKGAPALGLEVDGFLHKGRLYVSYNAGMDLYDVIAVDSRGRELATSESVYADQLVNVIDRMVEKGDDEEAYKRRVLETFGFSC